MPVTLAPSPAAGYDQEYVACDTRQRQVSVVAARTTDGGASFSAAARVSSLRTVPTGAVSAARTNALIPAVGGERHERLGAIVGDYVSVSWSGGRPFAVLPLATDPEGDSLREAVYAATAGRS